VISRRAVLTRSPLAALGALSGHAGTDGLAAHAARAGVVFGTEATRKVLADHRYAALIASECAIIVDGADLLPVNLRPTPETFSFAAADATVAYAARNGLAFRGHNLVWHLSQAEWLASIPRKQAARVLERHVATVCRRYAGRTHSWDVVNECVDPDDDNPLGLCNSPWLALLGPDYVRRAFETARAADPRALLCLNESGLEAQGREGQRMRRAILLLLEELIRQGVPIQALGVECHLVAGRESVDDAAFTCFLQDVAALGLQVFVSELDVSDRFLPADVAGRDIAVARGYAALLEIALSNPAVTTVVTWGLSDRYSWLGIDPEVRRGDGMASRGALFDDELRRKPAYAVVRQALDRKAPSAGR